MTVKILHFVQDDRIDRDQDDRIDRDQDDRIYFGPG